MMIVLSYMGLYLAKRIPRKHFWAKFSILFIMVHVLIGIVRLLAVHLVFNGVLLINYTVVLVCDVAVLAVFVFAVVIIIVSTRFFKVLFST